MVLGLDAGGTGTRAVLVDRDGAVLGWGKGGPANPRDLDPSAVRAALSAAVEGAREHRGGPLAAVCAGLAGVWTAEERASARRDLLPAALRDVAQVVSDLEAAHAGAFCGGPGVLLIAGTGAACLGRDAAGRVQRAGGWGPLVDDAGGAWDLARRALAAAARAADGRGPSTRLTQGLVEALGAADLRGAIGALEGPAGARDRVAALAPLVTGAAAGGDAVARELLFQGADELARAAEAVSSALGLVAPAVAAAGGLAADPAHRDALDRALRARLPAAHRVDPRLAPALGAALLALGRSGEHVRGAVLDSLASSSQG